MAILNSKLRIDHNQYFTLCACVGRGTSFWKKKTY